ncbi:reverse transcriptase domain-containing protein [Tanacetum coccineum]
MNERRNNSPSEIPYMDIKRVLVKKSEGSWRMCIDFKNLNLACQKDYYPLPDIDRKIESVVGFQYKCFLDAYKGYHQVQMAQDDEEKTTFYTDQGTYYYTKIPFGLKNAGATYQSLSGKLAALKRFLSRPAKKSLPFFETLKEIIKENKDEYRWTESAEKAFQEMKKVIVELPLLTTPVKEETLYVYVAAVTEAVSTELLTERKGKQCPIHYEMQILNKAQASRKLAKYSVELGSYNITYKPRNAIKGQVLADFLSESPVGTPTEEFF